MYINIEYKPYSIKNPTYDIIKIENIDFPALFIDKDSYITSARVITALDMRFSDKLYNLQIGKYSAVAEGIKFYIDLDHDYKSVFQGCISEFKNEDINSQYMFKKKRKGEIIIGNDCWIGNNATIMNGVVVHDGAVVAAESVVTKDVPPYTIVGGNPAKVLKKRFDDEIIDALRIIRWWDWDSRKLITERESIIGDVTAFISKHFSESWRRIDNLSKKDPFYKRFINTGKVFAYIVDHSIPVPSYPYIIKEFCSAFNNMNSQLILYFPPCLNNKDKAVKSVCEELKKYEDSECFVSLVYDDLTCIESIIKNCDAYITSRSPLNIYAIGMAELFGKDIVSGFSMPIW